MPDADADALPSPARQVASDGDVQELAAAILDPARTRPIVAVTTKPSEEQPFVDAEALAVRIAAHAGVWVIVDPDHAWALTDRLPKKIDVYGGAVRAWHTIPEGSEPYPSDHPQWTVFSREEGPKVVELIGGYLDLIAERPLPAFAEIHTGTVTVVRKAGAELELESGIPAFASVGHLTQHGEIFHAADVLQRGQEVQVRTGAWNPQAGRLSVTMREFAPDPWERLAEVYEPGMLIEGGVSGVTQFGAFVELLPGAEGLLHKSKIADEFVEYVDDYVQEGDRITVRLLNIDPGSRKAEVSLRGVPRGATPARPASIFPGGPPWLPDPAEIAASVEETDGLDSDAREYEPVEQDPTAATAATADTADTAAPEGAVTGPTYAAQLQALVALVLEHGAAGAPLAATLAGALERGAMTFDAALDEADGSSEEPGEPVASLRNAAGDLIDALRQSSP